jgi:hypothetical protein
LIARPQSAVCAVNALPRKPLSAGSLRRAGPVSSRYTASSRSLTAAGRGSPAPHDPAAQVRLDHQPEAVEPFGVRGAAAEQGGLNRRSGFCWSGRAARASNGTMGNGTSARCASGPGPSRAWSKISSVWNDTAGATRKESLSASPSSCSPWPPAFGERSSGGLSWSGGRFEGDAEVLGFENAMTRASPRSATGDDSSARRALTCAPVVPARMTVRRR